jgi:hypothetical protein
MVADSGVNHELVTQNFQSLVWIALSFPAKRLIGYLYSVDKVIWLIAKNLRHNI